MGGSARGGRAGAIGLVLVSLTSYEGSAAIAVSLFPEAGPVGMVTYRLVFSAIVLLAVARPSLRRVTREGWACAAAFGASLAVMNTLFYLALTRIGLGAAVTVEAVGPLVLSVALSRRALAWLWAALGCAGVALLGRGGLSDLDPGGIALALGAGAAWAAYIVCSRRAGQIFDGIEGLALAMGLGAIVLLPMGIATAGADLARPRLLGLGLAVAIGSSALPYALELVALRRLPAAVFSVLMTLAPAAAALSGFLFLHQGLAWPQLVGIAAVIGASIGAIIAAPGAPAPTPPPEPG
jgi:inner membrane transporter RhtA